MSLKSCNDHDGFLVVFEVGFSCPVCTLEKEYSELDQEATDIQERLDDELTKVERLTEEVAEKNDTILELRERLDNA